MQNHSEKRSTWNRFKEALLQQSSDKNNPEVIRKVLLLFGISGIGAIFLTLLGAIAFYQDAYLLGILDFSVAFILILLLVLIRINGFHPVYVYAGTCIMFLLYNYLFISGGVDSTAFMWLYTFPLFSQFLLGSRWGIISSLLLLSCTIVYLVLDISSPDIGQYDLNFALRFVPSFLTVAFFSYLYERSRSESYAAWEAIQMQLEDLVAERTKSLNAEIEKRRSREKELYMSENRLSLALKGANCGMWDWHIPEETVFFDANYYQMAGYEPNEFPYKFEEWEKRVHPDDIAVAKELIQQYLTGEKDCFTVEFRFKAKAGSWMWILGQGEIVERDNNGSPTRLTGLHIDISQSKMAEEALQEERAFNASLINTAQLIILVMDETGRIKRINPYMEELTGYREAEVKGKDWFDTFLTPADHSQIRELFKKAVVDIDVSGQINPIIAKDGRELLVEWYSKVLKDADGGIVGLLSFGIDISERKKAENLLVHQQMLLQRAQELGQIGSWEYDPAQKVFSGTEVGNRIYGIPNGLKAKYKHLLKRVHPEDREYFDRNWETALKAGTLDMEHRIIVNSEVKWVREKAEIEFDKHGAVVGGVGFTQDITERKQAEEQRLSLEEQLRQKHKMEAVGYMAGGIAHNFNNTLSIILGNIELAQLKQHRNSEVVPLLENAKMAVHRSRDLVQKIFAYSRKGAQVLAPISLQSIVSETVTLLKSTLPATINLQQVASAACDAMTIHADASQIQEVLLNLCNNAIYAIDGKGMLTISLEPATLETKDIPAQYDVKPGHYARLSVKDNGCGMSAEILDKIFDPFFTTKEKYEGAGMGLATVQGIVAQHGGLIKVNSVPGQGTNFSLYFPIIAAEASAQAEELQTTIPRGEEHVLFIDDDTMLASLGEQILSEMGYRVTVMTDSQKALKLFTANPNHFDLVISDQTMPELTGADLIKKLKEVKPGIPTILCTGFSNKVDEDKAKELGISAFMMKPLDMQKLAQTIRRVLDGEQQEEIA